MTAPIDPGTAWEHQRENWAQNLVNPSGRRAVTSIKEPDRGCTTSLAPQPEGLSPDYYTGAQMVPGDDIFESLVKYGIEPINHATKRAEQMGTLAAVVRCSTWLPPDLMDYWVGRLRSNDHLHPSTLNAFEAHAAQQMPGLLPPGQVGEGVWCTLVPEGILDVEVAARLEAPSAAVPTVDDLLLLALAGRVTAGGLRVLLAEARVTHPGGTFTRGRSRLGIEAAMSPGEVSKTNTKMVNLGVLKRLVQGGPVYRHDRRVPGQYVASTYQWCWDPKGLSSHPYNLYRESSGCEVSPIDWKPVLYSLDLSHDAWRSRGLSETLPLLLILAGTRRAWKTTEIVRSTDLPLSTVKRHLSNLEKWGWITRTKAGRVTLNQVKTSTPWGRLLDSHAERAGTVGMKRKAIRQMKAEQQEAKEAFERWSAQEDYLVTAVPELLAELEMLGPRALSWA